MGLIELVHLRGEMNMIMFNETYHEYFLAEETDFYKYYHNPEIPFFYPCNVLKFKKSPTLEEYMEIERKLMKFQQEMNQDYIYLYAVENTPFSKEIEQYLLSENYSIAGEELLSINPEDFYYSHSNEDVRVELVENNQQLKNYIDFMYQLNLKNGSSFAQKKQVFYVNRFHSPKVQQINAYLNGKVVGTASIILSTEFVEIDHFEVVPTAQHNGVGTEIQKFIMLLANDRKVILVVDKGTDANKMYYHQHYQFSGYQISAFKRFFPFVILDIPQSHPSSTLIS